SGFMAAREPDPERRSAAELTLDLDAPTVVLHHLARNRQPEAGPTGPLRVERLEDAVEPVRRDPRPVVRGLDDDLSARPRARRHPDVTTLLHHVARVAEDVEESLADLRLIELDRGQKGLEIERQLHPALAEVGLKETGRRRQRVVQALDLEMR